MEQKQKDLVLRTPYNWFGCYHTKDVWNCSFFSQQIFLSTILWATDRSYWRKGLQRWTASTWLVLHPLPSAMMWHGFDKKYNSDRSFCFAYQGGISREGLGSQSPTAAEPVGGRACQDREHVITKSDAIRRNSAYNITVEKSCVFASCHISPSIRSANGNMLRCVGLSTVMLHLA